MISREVDIQFYINPTVAKSDRDRILRIANTLPGSRVEELSPEFTVPEKARIVVASGGDGTALAVAEKMYDHQVLAIDPCGSWNGLR